MAALKDLLIKYKDRLDKIAEVIEDVDNRCMAVDGPVTPTNQEISLDEIRKIYRLSKFGLRRKA